MKCKECGMENAETFNFCSNCGSKLDTKIRCSSCGELVEDNMNFCPFCANNLKKPVANNQLKVEKNKANKDRTKLYAIITNSLVILTCLGLIFILFGTMGSRTAKVDDEVNISITTTFNFIDIFDASINGLKDYDSKDFYSYIESNILNFNFDINNLTNFKKAFSNINPLNALMVDNIDNFILQKILVYAINVLVLAMLVLPLVLLGLSIYDLTKFKYTKKYKKFFFVTLLLGFVAKMFVNLMGFTVGPAIIFYIIFSMICLLYSFIIECITKERKFDGSQFTFKLITSLMLLLVIFLTSSNIATLGNNRTSVRNVGINYTNYAMILNTLKDDKLNDDFVDANSQEATLYFALGSGLKAEFPYLYNTEDMQDQYRLAITLGLIISLSMLIVTGLLLSSLGIETWNNIHNSKRKPTFIFFWLAFVVELATIIFTLITNSCFNESNDYTEKYYKLSLGSGIVVLTIFTFILSLYHSIFYSFKKTSDIELLQ